MLRWDVQSSSGPLTTTPCSYSKWAQITLPGERSDSIRYDYRALGVIVKGMGAQMVFSSTLLVRGKGVRRKALIGQVNH